MKAQHRKTIDAIASSLSDQVGGLQEIGDEIREAFDDLSERAQEGERGQAMEEEADQMDEAISEIENAVETLNGLAGT